MNLQTDGSTPSKSSVNKNKSTPRDTAKDQKQGKHLKCSPRQKIITYIQRNYI